jgi:hypothetical protein
VLQHGDHRESGFGAPVTAAPGAGEAVAAPAGSLVEQRRDGRRPGIPAGTVKSQTARALARMGEVLSPPEPATREMELA